MCTTCDFHEAFCSFLPLIIFLIIWELLWKFIALWKAARNNHLAWFIAIAIFNTIGILPLVYILIQKKKDKLEKENKA
ncbi:MAG: DUF5652 family protein [Bacteroidota bacterium]